MFFILFLVFGLGPNSARASGITQNNTSGLTQNMETPGQIAPPPDSAGRFPGVPVPSMPQPLATNQPTATATATNTAITPAPFAPSTPSQPVPIR